MPLAITVSVRPGSLTKPRKPPAIFQHGWFNYQMIHRPHRDVPPQLLILFTSIPSLDGIGSDGFTLSAVVSAAIPYCRCCCSCKIPHLVLHSIPRMEAFARLMFELVTLVPLNRAIGSERPLLTGCKLAAGCMAQPSVVCMTLFCKRLLVMVPISAGLTALIAVRINAQPYPAENILR